MMSSAELMMHTFFNVNLLNRSIINWNVELNIVKRLKLMVTVKLQ